MPCATKPKRPRSVVREQRRPASLDSCSLASATDINEPPVLWPRQIEPTLQAIARETTALSGLRLHDDHASRELVERDGT